MADPCLPLKQALLFLPPYILFLTGFRGPERALRTLDLFWSIWFGPDSSCLDSQASDTDNKYYRKPYTVLGHIYHSYAKIQPTMCQVKISAGPHTCDYNFSSILYVIDTV